MNKIFDKWKNYLLKEEAEIAVPNQKRKDINMTRQRLREVMTEIQDMAMRLEEIQNQLIEEYDAGTITYRPGREFQHAAKKLASADEYGSLANSLNRYIEVDVSLSNIEKRREQ